MKILIGYDGSNESRAAVEVVRKRALTLNAKVYVVTSLFGDSPTTTKEIEESKEGLDHVQKLFEENSIPVETHLLVRGLRSGEDLIEFAKENEVDEIVVGVRERSPVGQLIFGPNVRYVVLHAHCPVLTVKCRAIWSGSKPTHLGSGPKTIWSEIDRIANPSGGLGCLRKRIGCLAKSAIQMMTAI